MSVVCEAFGCLPSAALRELQEAPAGLVWRVLDLRAFARAKEDYDRTQNDPRATIEEGPQRMLVEEIMGLAMVERRAERRKSQAR